MAINFPVPATVGETFTDPVTGVTFTWNGYGWTQGGSAPPVDAYTKAESDANFVNVPGDVMTGALQLVYPDPVFLIDKIASGQNSRIMGRTAGANRWTLDVGNNEPESTGNAGSNFALQPCDDAGTPIGSRAVLHINRATGVTDFSVPPTVLGVPIGGGVSGDYVLKTGDTMSGPLSITAASARMSINGTGGSVADLSLMQDGLVRWLIRNDPTQLSLLRFDDTEVQLGVPLVIDRTTGTVTVNTIMSAAGIATRLGTGAADGHSFNLSWANSTPELWVDNTLIGGLAIAGNYVLKTGDTMSGPLVATALTVNTTGAYADFFFNNSGIPRSMIRGADPGANNLEFHRYDAAGGYLGSTLSISNATGEATFTTNVTVNGVLNASTINGWATWTNYATCNLTTVSAVTGAINNLTTAGTATFYNDVSVATPGGGNVHLNLLDNAGGNAVRAYFYWDRAAGEVKMRNIASQGEFIIAANGIGRCAFGVSCKVGMGGAYQGNCFNMQWGGNMRLWVDNSDLGIISVSSDYRIKKDVVDLPSMWDVVKALRPISYTQAEYTPQIEIEHWERQVAAEAARLEEVEGAEPRLAGEMPQMFPADDIERWGFVAHELQATLLPSAATGVKDDPIAIQSPNPMTIIAALTKALQEAMTQIEVLQSRVGNLEGAAR